MQYYLVDPSGQRYGPADLATLNQWAQTNRLLPTSILIHAATGQQVAASQVPGLYFPMQGGNPGPHQPYQTYPRADVASAGQGELTAAWVLGGIGLPISLFFGLCCPIISALNVFSILGIILAHRSKQLGNLRTSGAMWLSIVGVAIGPIATVVILALAAATPNN